MFDLSQPSEEHYPDLVRAAARARATMTAHTQEPDGRRALSPATRS